MSILAFVFSVAFGLLLLFVVVFAARRGNAPRSGGNYIGGYTDGGASFSDSGPGADCGSSDGGGGCDGGGGGD